MNSNEINGLRFKSDRLLVGPLHSGWHSQMSSQSNEHTNFEPGEPLAKFIERGEFSLCSRGGAAGAQAGAGLSCVTRSI